MSGWEGCVFSLAYLALSAVGWKVIACSLSFPASLAERGLNEAEKPIYKPSFWDGRSWTFIYLYFNFIFIFLQFRNGPSFLKPVGPEDTVDKTQPLEGPLGNFPLCVLRLGAQWWGLCGELSFLPAEALSPRASRQLCPLLPCLTVYSRRVYQRQRYVGSLGRAECRAKQTSVPSWRLAVSPGNSSAEAQRHGNAVCVKSGHPATGCGEVAGAAHR